MGKYYYLNAQNEQQGPAEAGELKGLGVTENTLVWTQGMPQWAPAGNVDELKQMFVPVMEEMAPPPAPTPAPTPSYQPASSAPVSQSGNQSSAPAMGTAYNKVERTPTPAATSQPSAPVSSPSPSSPSLPNGKPENNMIWAVLSTVLCCIPIGIYAIICANKVDELYNAGNVEEANKQAAEAKKWAIIGAAAGAVGAFLYTIIMIIASLNN